MKKAGLDDADELIPVIVGVGQLLDRPTKEEDGLEPLALILKALSLADQDSNFHFLKHADSIDIENITSRNYPNIEALIASNVNPNTKRCVYHEVSGDLPIKNLCEAANRIANGLSQISIICGGESSWSVMQAKKYQKSLDHWGGTAQNSQSWIPKTDEIVRQYHLHIPARAYALYENACRTQWQQSFEQGQLETAVLQAQASMIASANPYAWQKSIKSVDDILTPSPHNKYIAWPYTKLMVANNYTNCATAIILTNLKLAKQHNINPKKIIYIHAGGYAKEPDNILKRDNYYHSAAMESVFERLFSANQLSIDHIDFSEIYSCFPCVTKLAKRIIHPSDNQLLTIVGGMTFCRGQLSNFMSQALVTMVQKLRIEGKNGILYGNGHYLTHAAGITLATTPPRDNLLPINLDLQTNAELKMGTSPEFIDAYEGVATIETYTVTFDKSGLPVFGIIVARNAENKRFVALTSNEPSSGHAALLETNREIIGTKGKSVIKDGFNIWHW